MFGVRYKTVPLDENFKIDINLYKDIKDNVIIANPNAQTGVALSADEIEELIKQDKDRLVVVDEAYVDFGAQTVLPLVKKYGAAVAASA